MCPCIFKLCFFFLKVHLALLYPSNRWSLGCVPRCIRCTLCVICHYIQGIVWSSVAAWLSWPQLDNCLCFTQTAREYPATLNLRVPLCGLVLVPKLRLRCGQKKITAQTERQISLPDIRWWGVMFYCIINQFQCPEWWRCLTWDTKPRSVHDI